MKKFQNIFQVASAINFPKINNNNNTSPKTEKLKNTFQFSNKKETQEEQFIKFDLNKDQDFQKFINIFTKKKLSDKTPIELAQIDDCLSDISFIKNLREKIKFTQEELCELYKRFSYEHFTARETVFHMGDKGKKFYIILKGSVFVMLEKNSINKNQQQWELSDRELNQITDFEARVDARQKKLLSLSISTKNDNSPCSSPYSAQNAEKQGVRRFIYGSRKSRIFPNSPLLLQGAYEEKKSWYSRQKTKTNKLALKLKAIDVSSSASSSQGSKKKSQIDENSEEEIEDGKDDDNKKKKNTNKIQQQQQEQQQQIKPENSLPIDQLNFRDRRSKSTGVINSNINCQEVLQIINNKKHSKAEKDLKVSEIEKLKSNKIVQKLRQRLHIVAEKVSSQKEKKKALLQSSQTQDFSKLYEHKLSNTQFLRLNFPQLFPINILRNGDFFGEVALSQNVLRTATIVCKEDTHVLALTREDYESILKDKFQSEKEGTIQLMQDIPIFKFLNQGRLVQLINQCKIKEYTKDFVFYDEGAEIQNIYFLQEGQIELSFLEDALINPEEEFNEGICSSLNLKYLSQKQQQLVPNFLKHKYTHNKRVRIAIIVPGQMFGYEEYFDSPSRKYKAQCLTSSCKVIELEKQKFDDLMKNAALSRILKAMITLIDYRRNASLERLYEVNLQQNADLLPPVRYTNPIFKTTFVNQNSLSEVVNWSRSPKNNQKNKQMIGYQKFMQKICHHSELAKRKEVLHQNKQFQKIANNTQSLSFEINEGSFQDDLRRRQIQQGTTKKYPMSLYNSLKPYNQIDSFKKMLSEKQTLSASFVKLMSPLKNKSQNASLDSPQFYLPKIARSQFCFNDSFIDYMAM